jgi:hypothetical protein
MSSPDAFAEWEQNKSDFTVWRRFWALVELRRKWKWADWFYRDADRADGEIVAPTNWSAFSHPQYMVLSLWIALLKSVHEGITETLDPIDMPKQQRVDVAKVLPPVPNCIRVFPATKGTPFRDFRNAVFHCQWTPHLAKFKLDDNTCRKLETLHRKIGEWIEKEFQASYVEFAKKYAIPKHSLLDPDMMKLFDD